MRMGERCSLLQNFIVTASLLLFVGDEVGHLAMAVAVCLRKLLMMILFFFETAILSSGGCIIFRYSTIMATFYLTVATSRFLLGEKKFNLPIRSFFLPSYIPNHFSKGLCHATFQGNSNLKTELS